MTDHRPRPGKLQMDQAKSRCVCGCTGDGLRSQHGGIIGHGPCLTFGCNCRLFTWLRYMTPDEQSAYLEQSLADSFRKRV